MLPGSQALARADNEIRLYISQLWSDARAGGV